MDTAPSAPPSREAVERKLDSLPMLPSIVGELMSLDPEADDFRERVVEIAQKEPAVAAKLLSVSNGVQSAPVAPITSINEAVRRLGARKVSDMLSSFAVMMVFKPTTPAQNNLWRHALQSAVAAQEIARQTEADVDPQQAYVTGLLHDIGRFVLSELNPNETGFGDLAEWNAPVSPIEAERSACGIDHVSVGLLAGRKWWLPAAFTQVIKVHHDFDPLEGKLASTFHPMVRIVQQAAGVSLLMMHGVDGQLGDSPRERVARLGELCICPRWEAAPLNGPDLLAALPNIRARSAEQLNSLGLAA